MHGTDTHGTAAAGAAAGTAAGAAAGSDGRSAPDDPSRTGDSAMASVGPPAVAAPGRESTPGGGTPSGAGSTPAGGAPERLVPADRAQALSARWDAVKGSFVDEPRDAVRQADALVGELLDELDRLFREQRRALEHGLDTDDTSTEDLRLALRRYRSFFDRLLSL